MVEAEELIHRLKKKTYKEHLDRLGYFCDICGKETRNENGLLYFESDEAVQPLKVCRDCLPEDFE